MNHLLIDIPRGVHSRELKHQDKPAAGWAETIEEGGLLPYDEHAGNQIMIGDMDGSLIGVLDDRHITTVAGSRSGKSVTLTANLFYYRGSVLAIDPKGELTRLTASRRANLGQKVKILDPFGIVEDEKLRKDYGASFNPMAFLTPYSKTLIEDAGLIADAFVLSDKGHPDHWDDTARNFIEGVLLLVATHPAFEEFRHLVTVRRLLVIGMDYLDQTGMKGLQCCMESSELDVVQMAAADFFEKPDNERASVISTARRHTKFLDFPRLQTVLEEHDFNLEELKTWPGGMTIYLCLPGNRIATCSRWFRLFVNQVIVAMEREQTKPDIPVLLALDEFANAVGYLKIVEVAAGLVAGYGVKIWVILQDLGQLKALYKERWETFLGNSGVVQCFGNNDLTTLEWISKRCGTTSIMVRREAEVSAEQSFNGMDGYSWGLETCDLVTPAEAAQYFGRDDPLRRQVIIRPGPKPIILSRVEWYKRKDMKCLAEEKSEL